MISKDSPQAHSDPEMLDNVLSSFKHSDPEMLANVLSSFEHIGRPESIFYLSDVTSALKALSNNSYFILMTDFALGHLYIPDVGLRYELLEVSSSEKSNDSNQEYLAKNGFTGNIPENARIYRFTMDSGGKRGRYRIFVEKPFQLTEEWTLITNFAEGITSYCIKTDHTKGTSVGEIRSIDSYHGYAFDRLLSAMLFPQAVATTVGTWSQFKAKQIELGITPTPNEPFNNCSPNGHIIYPNGISRWIDILNNLHKKNEFDFNSGELQLFAPRLDHFDLMSTLLNNLNGPTSPQPPDSAR